MISKIVGTIDYIDYYNMGLNVLLNCGIAYFVKFFYVSECEVGQKIELHTVALLREDSQTLWGFTNVLDKKLFEILIDIGGVGPKTAFNIVHKIGINDVIESVKTENPSILKIPGVGDKMAKKIILELPEKPHFKVLIDDNSLEQHIKNKGDFALFTKRKELIDTLINFGYEKSLIEYCIHDLNMNEDIQILIKKSLKLLLNNGNQRS